MTQVKLFANEVILTHRIKFQQCASKFQDCWKGKPIGLTHRKKISPLRIKVSRLVQVEGYSEADLEGRQHLRWRVRSQFSCTVYQQLTGFNSPTHVFADLQIRCCYFFHCDFFTNKFLLKLHSEPKHNLIYCLIFANKHGTKTYSSKQRYLSSEK